MKQILYIDCCIRRECSRTRKLAEYFIDKISFNKDYTIDKLILMDEPLQYLSEGFFAQRESLLAKGLLDHPRFRYAHQFQQAEKLVIAAPFWDLSFPALLKVYIENVCLDGITFHCDENGCKGTCRADRLLFITTRGGNYADSYLECGVSYMRALCEFWGIPRFDTIVIDGIDLGLELPEKMLERTLPQVDFIVNNF